MSNLQRTDTADDFALNMATIIRSLMARKRMTAGQMQAMSGIPSNTWAQRMKRGNWSARELAIVAGLLECGIGDLFADPAAIGVQNWKILSGVDFDGDREPPTPPKRGHLSSVQ